MKEHVRGTRRGTGAEAGRGLRRPVVRALFAAIVACGAVCWGSAAALGKVTTTEYSYNADGALTAITTRAGDGPAETRFLTWDDFVPDAETPTDGQVVLGDGRLVGIGSSPGGAAASETFAFDPRDRLLSYSSAGGTHRYDYNAAGVLSSSSNPNGDTLRFYTNAAAHPQVTNTYDPASDLWSTWLGGNRILSDGTERVVLQPRKDAVCSYDPLAESLVAYPYDAFGATSDGNAVDSSVRDNPFRYAGEYRDSLWGGYYLRGRWYHPDLPLFVSRDPQDQLNRYAYGAGNPVMNSDPGGHSVEGFLRSVDHALNSGIQGHFDRVFLAPILGVLQIAAYPKQFFEAVRTDRNGTDVLLIASIAAEVVGGYMDSAAAGFVRMGARFGYRALADVTIGVAGALASSVHGINQFDYNAFVQGLEYTAFTPWFRGVSGLNVRTGFQLGAQDVVNATEFLERAPDQTAVIFRQKVEIPSNPLLTKDKPWQQSLHLGQYHERLIAVTKDEIHTTDLVVDGVRIRSTEYDDFASLKNEIMRFKGKFELVGRVDRFRLNADNAFFSNPKNFPILENETVIAERDIRSRGFKVNRYSSFRNNCQHHAYAVLQDMGLR